MTPDLMHTVTHLVFGAIFALIALRLLTPTASDFDARIRTARRTDKWTPADGWDSEVTA